METDTTELSYWLNWRFLISALYVFATLISAVYFIWKYEGKGRLNDYQQVPIGVLYKDEAWKTCHECVHPVWLLLFRIIAFCVLLTIIVGNTVVDGFVIFYYYTQWTFALTTIYFGLASAFSIYGLCHNDSKANHSKPNSRTIDAEQGPYGVSKIVGGNDTPLLRGWSDGGEDHAQPIAGYMEYLFQIVYQVAGGAVLITDVVYWFFLFPVKSARTSKIAVFDICMHSVNTLILGDAVLNRLRFPIFRIAYFIIWTGVFVICQWIIHVFISLPWPYPFMDLSPPSSPLWYIAVGLMHIPTYGGFTLIVNLKHKWLSRSNSDIFQDLR